MSFFPLLVCLSYGGLLSTSSLKIRDRLYLFHPKTSDLKISHLMFADNVMIFFNGSASSLHDITECLDDFASWSSLHMN